MIQTQGSIAYWCGCGLVGVGVEVGRDFWFICSLCDICSRVVSFLRFCWVVWEVVAVVQVVVVVVWVGGLWELLLLTVGVARDIDLVHS